jgi:hypothetical protein
LSEEAEKQRVARDGMRKVLEVGTPVIAQR